MRLGLLLLLCLPLLQGCAAIVVGAAVGTTAVALDSRDVNTQVDDTAIRLRILGLLNRDDDFDQQRVRVISYNGDVLLFGQVASAALKQKAERYARETDGVVHIFNQLTIGEVASLRERADDSWITTRVKAELLRENDLDLSGVKVVTERREVFLLGLVNQAQADRAIEIARHVSRVNRVVNALVVQS